MTPSYFFFLIIKPLSDMLIRSNTRKRLVNYIQIGEMTPLSLLPILFYLFCFNWQVVTTWDRRTLDLTGAFHILFPFNWIDSRFTQILMSGRYRLDAVCVWSIICKSFILGLSCHQEIARFCYSRKALVSLSRRKSQSWHSPIPRLRHLSTLIGGPGPGSLSNEVLTSLNWLILCWSYNIIHICYIFISMQRWYILNHDKEHKKAPKTIY